MLIGIYSKLIAVISIIAVAMGAWMYVSHLRTENTLLTVRVNELNTKLSDQNAAIDTLKKDGDARVASGIIEITKAQTETARAKSKSIIIYKAKPSTLGNDCKSALDMINMATK